MKNFKITFCFISLISFGYSGCISIGTFEKYMKQCREIRDRSGEYETQITSLKEKNETLEASLASQQQEKGKLEEKIQVVRSRYDELVEELKGEIEKGNIEVVSKGEDLKVTVGDKILFASGRSDLQPAGKKVLFQVARVLGKIKDQTIRIDGHSDGLKISKKIKNGYTSNWDLSAARSASVVRFLEESGISGKNLMLAAFAEYRPISENDTPKGRQENRRVEISLIKNP